MGYTCILHVYGALTDYFNKISLHTQENPPLHDNIYKTTIDGQFGLNRETVLIPGFPFFHQI